MGHPLTKRLFVFLLAVFVTAGVGLSTVQANAMQLQMMGMGDGSPKTEMAMPDMAMPAPAKCPDCDLTGKGMADCVMPACTGQVALAAQDGFALAVRFLPVRLQAPASVVLHGLAAAPDPYPPRISDIG